MNVLKLGEKAYEISDKKCINMEGLKIDFSLIGDNNSIVIENPFVFKNFNIRVTGDNNFIHIKGGSKIENTYIGLNMRMNGIKFLVGSNFICTNGNIAISGDNDIVEIGDDVVFENDIYMCTQDGHTIYDEISKEVINQGEKIVIGNDVYIGSKTVFMKNVKLGNHIIVKPRSVITKSFEQSYIQLAGHPAKIIREGVVRGKVK